MSLSKQAIRLLRNKWRSPQPLAEELYLILLQDQDVETSPVSIDLGDNSSPTQISSPLIFQPFFGGVDIPDFSFDLFPNNPFGVEHAESTPDPVKKTITRKTTHYRTVREMAPGVVVSKQEDGTYTVTAYPLGLSSIVFDDRIETPSGKSLAGVGVLQIATGETIPAGTWVFVWRFVVVKITETRIIEKKGESERVVSRTVDMDIIHRDFRIQPPVWLS